VRQLGRFKADSLDVLDSFYAELERCRDHCSGRPGDRPPDTGRARLRPALPVAEPGIDTTFHKLRHYSATDRISGVDTRAVMFRVRLF